MIHLFHPLVLALLSLLSGLLPALRFSPPALPLAALALLLSCVAVYVVRRRRWSGGHVLALLLAAVGASGAALGAHAAARAAADCRLTVPAFAQVRVAGTLAAGAGPRAGEGSAPILPLHRAELEWEDGSCGGGLRVRLPEAEIHAPAGTRLVLHGRWIQAPPAPVRSPWPRRGIHAGFVLADSATASEPGALALNPLLTLRGATEERIRQLFPRHDAMAEALLLGRRERMDPEVRDRFARAGLVHLLAISGTHVGLLAGVVLVLGAAARLSRRRLTWVTLAATWAYLAMIGAPASAVRAGLMLSLALIAVLLQRPSAALPMVAAAALVLLALDPLYLLDPGFQLSFAGVGGILLMHRAVYPHVPAAWKRRPAVRWAVDSALVSAAAFAATAPITAHHFGSVAPIAILANLPALPLMSLALVGVLSATLLSPLSLSLARLCADGAGLAFDLLDRVAAFAARLPFGHVTTEQPDWPAWAAAFAASLLAIHLAPRARPVVRASVIVGAAAALLIAWPALARGTSGALEIHFLDVGQGDATVIRTPAGRWILIDAGPRERSYDAGARRVLPFLRAHGARSVELLVLTHPHLDHIGGAPAILDAIPVRTVVDPGLPVGSEVYLEVLDAVERTGARWAAARSGRTIALDGVVLDLLWPDEAALDEVRDANQISAVVRIRFGDFAALFTGDAGAEVERALVARHPRELRSQVLKLGHHGSSTSTSAELLAAVRPEIAIVSAGARNRYGHPSPAVLHRVREAGIELARTDLDGTVSLRVDPRQPTRWNRLPR